MIDPQWRQVRRVLAVRLDNLGDVLVTTPAMHAIKQSLPGVELTLFAGLVGGQVAALNPDIDDVLTYEAPWMDPWCQLPQDVEREQRIIDIVRARQFDAAVIFSSFRQSPLPAAYLCYLAGIPLRLAASIDGPGSLLTNRHKHPERMMHEVERGLDLVGAVGMETDNSDLVLRVPPEERGTVGALLPAGSGPLVVVHPGCTMPARTYPWEMFAEAADLLVEQMQARIVVTGSRGEYDLAARVCDRMRHPALNLAGSVPFSTFCALVQSADIVITNNTGPMHLAAALKVPVVALFALTNPPEQWGPWHVPHRQLFHDVPCRICYCRSCPYDHECLRLVEPRMIVRAAQELLDEARRGERCYDRPEPCAVGSGGVVR